MKVILTRDIKGVGRKYEEKNVSEGYAINFLIPQKMAVPATGVSAGQIKNLKETDLKHREAEEKKLDEELHRLANTNINISLKTNDKGSLFAKLTREKIADLLKERGFNIPENLIDLKESIKDSGTHSIPVKAGEKTTHFNLIIN